jgi:GT2 family glycosyltransferase
MNEMMHAHRLLCSGFVAEELFRHALGGGRADLGTVARYLSMKPRERPNLSFYFDRAFYIATNPEVERGGFDPLLHFIEFGFADRRAPHPMVDISFVLDQDPAMLGPTPGIDALVEMLEYDLAAPSPYFDPQEYRLRLGTSAPANAMLRHFLGQGLYTGMAANPLIDVAWYSQQNEDVPPDPYGSLRHFVMLGDLEGRAASSKFDGKLYRARYPDIAASGMAALRHYLLHGRGEGRQLPLERVAVGTGPALANASVGAPLPVDPEAVLRAHADMRARLDEGRQQHKDAVRATPPDTVQVEDIDAALSGLRFPAVTKPRLSILIPVFNEIGATVECLLSVRRFLPKHVEVVLADDCSTDSDALKLSQVPNLVVMRQEQNQGFIRNCNAAFARCRGEYVLLLNNDAQVTKGAIAHMMAALDADPTLAAVGPKILYPNGRLQEAGCFLRPNGESGMVGLFRHPDEGGFCHDRDVAYCSGAALMFRRECAGETLFDEAFRPAYCEDADLCLRFQAQGGRVRYLHQAMVVHHLSVSTNRQSTARKAQRIVANQQKLVERWGDMLREMDRVRVLAFYLPQFHPTPENDLWWGKGFTEWTNVAKAQPSYGGHYQPHLPSDLGFYDLRNRDALAQQAELAARYGVEGFCVYYYNFGKRRVLGAPMEVVRTNPDIPFRWCLCWANENWTKHWDGGEREILLEQSYEPVTLNSIIADAVAHAADPRYIRVNGKPMFLVYRPLLLPDPRSFADAARSAFAAAGHPGVHLAYVESMEAVDRAVRPADLGFDACVEFPPHGRAVPTEAPAEIVKEGWSGYRYDYPSTVCAFVERPSVPYTRYPAVFPSWDNTPRQPMKGTSFDGIAPEAFRLYVEEKIEEIRQFLMGDNRLLFVNAWNEWAEGTHLEPDTGYGHRWLEALRDAVAAKAWS